MATLDRSTGQQTIDVEEPAQPQLELTAPKKQRRWIRYAVIGGLLVLTAIIAVVVVFTATPYGQPEPERSPLSLDDVLSGRLAPRQLNGTWMRDRRGERLQRNAHGDLTLYNVGDGTARTLLAADFPGLSTSYSQQLSADGSYVLLEHLVERLFRHSRRSRYTLLAVNGSAAARPLSANGSASVALDYATFGPSGSQLLFVEQHDIYYLAAAGDPPTAVRRLTSSGSATVFNGHCDWAYEEEIFGRPSAIWLANDGRHLAYAQFDDERVQPMTMWHWGRPDGTLRSQYPDAMHLTYPKVGTANPRVRLFSVRLDGPGNSAPVELPVPAELRALLGADEPAVLLAVRWANPDQIVAVWSNREQNRAFAQLCDGRAAAPCAAIFDERSANGWLSLGEPLQVNNRRRQLAIVKPVGQQMHIVAQTLPDLNGTPASEQRALTVGAISVHRIVHWNWRAGAVFFLGNGLDAPQNRHLYVVADGIAHGADALNATGTLCLTCTLSNGHAHFDATFHERPTADAGNEFILIGQGPAVPRQDVYKWTPAVGGALRFVRELQSNAELSERLLERTETSVQYREVALAGAAGNLTARVRLLLPPAFDERQSYAMLVHVYAGPETYGGTSAWTLGWSAFLAGNRSVIVAQIDGRGSGRRTVGHLHALYRRLGEVEVDDQIAVAKSLAELSFIDAKRVGIWGHSYGGYATGMALAKDGDGVFRCGVSSAPVTDWTLYNTLYTERYMGLLAGNEHGYRQSSSLLAHAEGLRGKRFLLVHGTADDNVHYQQSAELARRLELRDIPFEQMTYPDETHSLAGVTAYHYRKMTHFFDRCFAQ